MEEKVECDGHPCVFFIERWKFYSRVELNN